MDEDELEFRDDGYLVRSQTTREADGTLTLTQTALLLPDGAAAPSGMSGSVNIRVREVTDLGSTGPQGADAA